MHPRERFEYSAIVDRPPLKLPDGARVVVSTVVNVENWDFGEVIPRQVMTTPAGVKALPDVPNWAWHEYGMRVGFWRLKAALDGFGVKATASINASVCLDYPRIAQAILDAGWEFMGHGFKQLAMPAVEDERQDIHKAISTIRDFTGKAPRGWLGPGLAETAETLDILAEEGIEYVADWCNDDQPYEMKVKSGRLVAVPYTVELNDIPIYLIQHHKSPEIFERAKDQFDTLYREGADSARVMCISTHPYITGVPHRIKYYNMIFDYIRQFEGVVFMTGSELLDWYNGETANG